MSLRHLLTRLRRPRCPLCFGRYADLALHQLTAHTDAELMQASEMRLR